MSSETRIKCRVSPGFFRDEFYVVIVGNGSSVLVHRNKISIEKEPEKGAEVEGLVFAYLLDSPEDREEALVELPGEPVVGGLRTWVPKSLLVGAQA